MAKGPTKLPRHHYIPVLYLSQWADGNGRLYEVSRPNGRSEVSVRPTGPKGTGYERGLYRLAGIILCCIRRSNNTEEVMRSRPENHHLYAGLNRFAADDYKLRD